MAMIYADEGMTEGVVFGPFEPVHGVTEPFEVEVGYLAGGSLLGATDMLYGYLKSSPEGWGWWPLKVLTQTFPNLERPLTIVHLYMAALHGVQGSRATPILALLDEVDGAAKRGMSPPAGGH